MGTFRHFSSPGRLTAQLKGVVPEELAHTIHRWRRRIGVSYENIFHCCTWKSASQWFIALFSHPIVLEQSGMGVVTLGNWYRNLLKRGDFILERPDDVRPLLKQKAPSAWAYPSKTVATTLYYTSNEFFNLPLPQDYRVFFVQRDPRDIVVSWYFSMLKSHTKYQWVERIRHELHPLDKADGIEWAIRKLHSERQFEILQTWRAASIDDASIGRFRFEDLAADHELFVKKVLDWLQIKVSSQQFGKLCYDLSFARLAGRAKGKEDAESHMRKGVSGDWRNHLSSSHVSLIDELTGGLVRQLGYL